MSKFPRFGNVQKVRVAHNTGTGAVHVDWKDVETLRRLMSPNGKIYGRKRLSTSASEQRMVAHARHLREHVDRLADKAYWQQFKDAPEFVVLFVPGEAFLAPALERDPALLEYAYARRVHIATPTTLVSLLRAVAYAWQQHSLTENAQEVFQAGKELYARLSTLGGHVDKLGRSLNSSVEAYNKTVASMERNLLPSARRRADSNATRAIRSISSTVYSQVSWAVSPSRPLSPK